MDRRQLLQRLAASSLLSGLGLSLPPGSKATWAPMQRVRPGDPGWPSPDCWAKLGCAVEGRLVAVRSPLADCVAQAPSARCDAFFKSMKNPYFLGDEVGLTQTLGWVGAWTSAPSRYAVACKTTADVVAAVNFAREHNLRLVVKGGGHSYLGTLCAADSLLVWTRAMNDVCLHDSFVGEGCSGRVAAQPAVSVGGGAIWAHAYDAVNAGRGPRQPAATPGHALRRRRGAHTVVAPAGQDHGPGRAAMRVLIVDDEAPARAKLRRMLGGFADVEIVGEAADGGAALELVARVAPDALFIDIQMPEIGGFDLAASLPDNAPALVFVTAFDQYALQAFEAQAIDYLLKPIVPDRLDLALQRLRVFVRGAEEGRSNGRTRTGPPRQLLVTDRGRTHIVRCVDIAWLEAVDNYVQLHLGGRSLLMRRTFTGLLTDLGPPFVRTHRSAAVALAQVSELRPRENGDAIVVLHDGTRVPCSRPYRNRLVALLTS